MASLSDDADDDMESGLPVDTDFEAGLAEVRPPLTASEDSSPSALLFILCSLWMRRRN